MIPTEATPRQELLSAAADALVLPHDLDISGRLARHNLLYGMGRIIWTLQEITNGATAKFYASPDFTVTRTPARWGSGFSYGGVLEVQGGTFPIIFPELRPNTCGATLCIPEREITQQEFIEGVAELRFSSPSNEWDYGRRNHFLNLYRSAQTGHQVIAVHGCPSAIRHDTDDGPGLFAEKSSYWQARIKVAHTPLGPFSFLVGQDATNFWENYQRCEAISKAERLAIARRVGGGGEVIANETHEGMWSRWLYVKGCHLAASLESTFPVFTEIGRSAYLVTPAASESSPQQSLPGDAVGILPHGTGYELPLDGGQLEVAEDRTRPIYVIRRSGNVTEAYTDFAHIPYNYRPHSIVRSWESSGLLRVVDELLPLVFTKF